MMEACWHTDQQGFSAEFIEFPASLATVKYGPIAGDPAEISIGIAGSQVSLTATT
jgi:hypothetical protein